MNLMSGMSAVDRMQPSATISFKVEMFGKLCEISGLQKIYFKRFQISTGTDIDQIKVVTVRAPLIMLRLVTRDPSWTSSLAVASQVNAGELIWTFNVKLSTFSQTRLTNAVIIFKSVLRWVALVYHGRKHVCGGLRRSLTVSSTSILAARQQ